MDRAFLDLVPLTSWPSTLAILATRLHLDLDFVRPSHASKLVFIYDKMLLDVDPRRNLSEFHHTQSIRMIYIDQYLQSNDQNEDLDEMTKRGLEIGN